MYQALVARLEVDTVAFVVADSVLVDWIALRLGRDVELVELSGTSTLPDHVNQSRTSLIVDDASVVAALDVSAVGVDVDW